MAGAGAVWTWWEKYGGFGFRGALGRVYEVPFGVELTPRNPAARKGGVIGGIAPDDVGGAMAVWATPPRSRIAFESLEKDYDLSAFIQEGEPMGEREARERREPDPVAPPSAAAETEAGPVEVERVDQVDGWPLALVRGEERPRIGHREVARRLGYAEEKKLLALAERVFGARWKLGAPWAEFREGARGPKSKDYLLTRHEVIRLTMRSDAPNADALQEEIARVFEAWLDGHLAPRKAPAPDASDPMVIALRLLGREGLELRAAVGAVDEKADRAVEDAAAARIAADEAMAIAEEAREAARAAAEPPPPGMRVRRDGAEVYGGPVPGSMAAVQCAARQGMPERGTACTHWVKLAIATGAVADPEATVLDQKHRADGRRWMPKALEYTETASRLYLRRLRHLGFDVVNGLVVLTRPGSVLSARAATESALSVATARAGGDGQQTIPGVENDTASKAS